MKNQEKYGVLLLGGYRTHQEMYSRYFAAEPRCRLVAFSDERDAPPERVELGRAFARDFGLPYIPDLDEALARDDIHIVSLCVEQERRGRVGVRCAEMGKHLYLDKPMAMRLEDAQAIVKAVKKAGVRSQMYSNVLSSWARSAKQALESGEIGELRAIHCDLLFAKGNAGTAPVGHKRKQKAPLERYCFVEGKPELFAVGVYPVAMINWLTKKAVKTVFGKTANYFFKEHIACDIEDFGTLVLTLEDGITASVAAGRVGWMSHPQAGAKRLHLVGTRDTLVLDASQSHLEVFADEPAFRPPPPHPLDPMGMWGSTQVKSGSPPKQLWISVDDGGTEQQNEVRAFVDCIEEGKECEMNAEMAVQSVAVITAGYQSAATGEVVRL